LKTVYLNFQSSDPRLASTRIPTWSSLPSQFGVYSSLKAAVRPPFGMYQQAQKFFHSKLLGDFDINAEEKRKES
jgi:hypothetical protein